MTARRKTDASGDEQLTITYGKWTQSLRVTTLCGVFLATPFGANLLKALGVSSPAAEQTINIQKDVKDVKDQVSGLAKDVTEFSKDIASIKANNTIINEKVDRLDQTFTGFKVDFNRFRTTPSNQ